MDSNDKPMVSIITPTFNRMQGLEVAIRSIDAQKETRWKHYIVCDGDAATKKWWKHWESKDKAAQEGKRVFIYLEDGPHGDFGYTPLNEGLKAATEPYFCVLADDNYWMHHHLSPLVQFMERHSDMYDFVYGTTILRHKNIPEYWKLRVSPRPMWNHIDLGEPLYKKELWEKYGPFEYSDKPEVGDINQEGNRYSTDWHFIKKCLDNKARWQFLNGKPSIAWFLDNKNLDPKKWQHDKLVIAAFPAGDGGCAWYRMKYPLNKMVEKGVADVMYYDPHFNKHRTDFIMMNADVLMFQGAGSDNTAHQMMELGRMGKLCVADSDDDVFHIDPDNQRFMDMGLHEVQFEYKSKEAALNSLDAYRLIVKNEGKDTAALDQEMERIKATEIDVYKVVLFRNGYAGFHIEKNADRVRQIQNCFRAADAVVTTTDVLAQELRFYNDNIRIFPNCLDLKIWRNDLKYQVNDGKLRIVWQGGSSHLFDLHLIRDALVEVLKKNPQCVFVCAGFKPDSFGRAFPVEQIEYWDWDEFKTYPYRMHRMRGDIGIIPLRNTQFANCKSNIKYVEMSALEMPVIASDNIVYNKDIIHGENGFLFKDDNEFKDQLQALIDNADLRMKLGKAGRKLVEDKYDIDKRYAEHIEWLELMWLKKMMDVLPNPESKNTLYPKLLSKWESKLGRKIKRSKQLPILANALSGG